ncbi:MAG: MBOAT family O-acyltransferase [Actinomycetota bacterium]
MLFPTVAFACFFCVAFLANWLLRPAFTTWRVTMIALSLFFYGWWDPRFVALLGASIVGNHLAAAALEWARPTRWRTNATLTVAVVANLAVLGVFKYYGFFVTSAINGLARFGIEASPPLLDLTLPIGISFFTFQAIGYLVDLRRGDLDEPLPFLDLAFFLSFFPQLVAGPIVRATNMAPQIQRRPDPRRVPAGEAFWLITIGLFKKLVISSYLATTLVDPVFDVPGNHSRAEVLLAVYGYAVQIYADFSGYTDIAIGCALLLGFRIPANFNAPYRATSLQDFWRRWHISLSSWLRDYLYIPLGGSQRGAIVTARNVAITMLLGGLWHGASFTFVIWGGIHAAGLLVERVVRHLWRPTGIPADVSRVVGWLFTFHVVALAWVFFRADSLERALDLLDQLVAGGEPAPLVTTGLVALITAALAAQFVPPAMATATRDRFARTRPALQAVTLAAGLTVVARLGPDGVAPFIYYQF